ncbi:mechanosensitive ion channel family protein [Vibrio sp. CK2-1]|uniref:mechanosensitive ion channel family protein n=1 Tax=Vibrio sp. CK2-1 TaxID=2912249 RepID=UPI001F2584A5|nr:mechanosensitive ion channel family protein [Vibrio sp. CK2-1]MCF7354608.1 mechanosensitive ion channel family protein [Vibrio sp. CK2-1]
MRYYLNFILILLISFSVPSFAQSSEESLSKSEINQITTTMKGLADRAKTLKGDRLSIVQLEIYNMNERLRQELSNAMDRTDHDTKFLTEQIQLQTKYYDFYLKYVEKKLDSLQDDIEQSSKEDRLLKQIPLNEMRVAQAVLYSEQYQNYAWLQTLGVNVDESLKPFKARLIQLAHYSSAALNYALTHRELLQGQLDGLPAGQAEQINLELSYLERDINTYSKALSNLVDTADNLGISTVELRHELFVATGDITHDLLSWAVLKSTFASWANQFTGWMLSNSPSMIFNVFMFILIMAIAKIIAQFTHKVLNKAVKAPHLKLSNLMQQFIVSMSVKLIFCVGLLIALAQIGLDLTPVIAGLGVAGIIIGFALQDTLSNFASGMMLLIYRPFDEGDWINAAGVEGTVSHVSLVNTTIRTFDNEVLLVPNSKIWMEVIINRTYERVRRVDMVFGISYSDSIPQAEKIFEEILSADERILKTPAPMIKVDNLNESSVDFIVRPWVRTEDYMDVMRDCTREVKMRFDAEGVNIPFPQRDVHLHISNPEALAAVKQTTSENNKHDA